MNPLSGMQKAIIYPNRARALSAKRSQAAQERAFDIDNTTVDDFAHMVWDLFGDGRRPIDSAKRTILVYGLLDSHGFDKSFGTADIVASFIVEGLEDLRKRRFDVAGLSQSEANVVGLAQEYDSIIAHLGYCEDVDCAAIVAREGKRWDISFSAAYPLSPLWRNAYREFNVPKYESSRSAFADIGDKRIKYLIPKGHTAKTSVVFESIEDSLKSGTHSIVVSDPDPFELFKRIAAMLGDACACALIASMSIKGTKFGSLLMCIADLLSDDADNWKNALFDLVASPYVTLTRFSLQDVYSGNVPYESDGYRIPRDIVAAFNADRTLTRENALRVLERECKLFSDLRSLFSDERRDGEEILSTLKKTANARFGSFALPIELKAIDSFKAALDAFFELDIAPNLSLILEMATMSVQLSSDSAASEDTQVLFMSLDQMKDLSQKSFDEIIICDVTDSAFNSKEKVESLTDLLEKIGTDRPPSALDRSRYVFECGIESARSAITLCHPLRDSSSSETFPSFAFEELLEEVYGDSLTSEDILEHSDTARELGLQIVSLGEGDFQKTVGQDLSDPVGADTFVRYSRGQLDRDVTEYVWHWNLDGQRLLFLSPSAIESYISCPYKWFIERVVRPRFDIEEFSNLEKGNFAHSVLGMLYKRVYEVSGKANVADIDLDDLRALYSKLFDQMFRGQRSLCPTESRYIPITKDEMVDVTKLKRSIWQCILFLRELPASFSVKYMEADFKKMGKIAPYAGVALNGRLDRLDTDENGDFYVIDYKGSIDESYNAGSAVVQRENDESVMEEVEIAADDIEDAAIVENVEFFSLPEHIQSLIYAQAARRTLVGNGRCKGAMYVRYSQNATYGDMRGSVSSQAHELTHLVNKDCIVEGDFEAFLDLVENGVQDRIDELKRSEIPLSPANSNACTYCTFEFCERRR